VGKQRFGVSSHLFRGQRLQREHLIEIAAAGFESLEIASADGHFDSRSPAAVSDLQEWLAAAQLELHGVSIATGAPIEDAEDALFVARRIPMKVLIVGVGALREAARTIDRLAELAAPLGVTVAVDSRSESMKPIGSLVHFVESVEGRAGIAIDCATVSRPADLADAMELASEHLASIRVPLDSAIDWSSAMTTMQKIGYEGAIIFDLPASGPVRLTLGRAKRAREKMQRWLTSI
jgi:hypothetical protein